MKRALVWLQRNLRLVDNPALYKAQQQADELLLLYIHDPNEAAPWQRGAASLWYLQQSLQHLAQQCAERQLVLNIVIGKASEWIPQLVARYQITHVCWQQQTQPELYQRDLTLARQLAAQGVQCRISHDGLLPNPADLVTQQGTPYRVFTPFYRQLRARLSSQTLSRLPPSTRSIPCLTLAEAIPAAQLSLQTPHVWQQKMAAHQQPGELAAVNTWSKFKTQALNDYPQQRDFPALSLTSQLSAPLHFGELSPVALYVDLLPQLAQQQEAAEAWLRQLIWREFAIYTLWHFPHTHSQSMDKRFSDDFWQPNADYLARWQQGETGIDIVDAGMQQLWQTGLMHNRVRMIVASFLCKNLQQPWQAGAAWFWQTLVDADLANNSMGWQWVAGCGVDAAPYYRIFNPQTQAEKFDPSGAYRRRWLGPGRRPKPMVDLKQSREAALQRYQQQIQGAKHEA